MNLRLTFVAMSATLLLLSACAVNPAGEFYRDLTIQWPASARERLRPPSGEPRVIASSDIARDSSQLQQQGFAVIGFAGFQGPPARQSDLIAQAKKVGAQTVLYASDFSHIEQGVRPLLSYQPGQTSRTYSYGTATANAYGSGGGYVQGSGSYSGYSTTTSPGTLNTDYVPYQRSVFNQGALFFSLTKPPILGVSCVPLSDLLRSKLQRNTGAVVAVVNEGGPAFRANILRGDVIIKIGNTPITTAEEAMTVPRSYAGQQVPITVVRGSQTRTIDVKLNPAL